MPEPGAHEDSGPDKGSEKSESAFKLPAQKYAPIQPRRMPPKPPTYIPATIETPVRIPVQPPPDPTPAPDEPVNQTKTGLYAFSTVVTASLAIIALCVLAALLLDPVIEEAGSTVTSPRKLSGGLTKVSDTDLGKLTVDVADALSDDVDASHATADVYTDGQGHQVGVAAVETFLFFPEGETGDAFAILKKANIQIDGATSYNAGALGGNLKCGSGTSDFGDLTACVWTDHGTVGIGLFLDGTQEENARLFVNIRGGIESRS